MRSNTALALYYSKLNKNSFNVLVGALETKKYFDNLDTYFIDPENLEEIEKILPNYERVVLCISFCTPQIAEVSKLVKSLDKDKLILVAGGPHPTGDPEGTLAMGFDFIIVGESEETFPKLLKAIDLDKQHEKILVSKKPVDLDDYPPFAVKHKRFNQIEITRGCSFGCKFCQATFIHTGPPRHRSVSNICKYVKIMVKHGLTDMRFITPNALSYGSKTGRDLNLEAIEKLLKSVRQIVGKKGKIFFGTFPSEVRPEFVTNDTIRLIKKYADNDNLVIGGQSGSPKILKECHRGHTVEDIYRAVKLTIKAGLKANVDFIFGLPGETEKDMNMTLKVMGDLIKMGARIHGHTFIPLAGTPYENARPAKLSSKTLEKLNLLASQGKLYGEWKKQMRFSNKITKTKAL